MEVWIKIPVGGVMALKVQDEPLKDLSFILVAEVALVQIRAEASLESGVLVVGVHGQLPHS